MILKISALAIIAAITAFLLKDFGWKGVPVFCLIAFVGVLSLAKEHLLSLGELFCSVGEDGGLGDEATSILKIIGVGYISGMTSEVCRDLGAASIASLVGLLARLEVLFLVMPYLLETLRLGMELLS